ncbi:MAG: cytochrome [Rubritepida sp.]|nr:cytochrome [Rubritepida sp.]
MRAEDLSLRLGAVAATVLAGAAWWIVAAEGFPPARRSEEVAALRAHGDPENGRRVILAKGCGACHHIPGIATARGRVGPSLDGIASQSFIAGTLPNTPANLAAWIMDPRRLAPGTAMPALDIGAADARDIAAYLSRQTD